MHSSRRHRPLTPAFVSPPAPASSLAALSAAPSLLAPSPSPTSSPAAKPWWPRKHPSPQSGAGLHAGCFAGAGHGLAVGFGRAVRRSRGTVVTPWPMGRLFVADGPMAGAFCGVGAGVGFGGMLALGVGVAFPRVPLPSLPRFQMPALPAFDGSVELPRPTDVLLRIARNAMGAITEQFEHPPNVPGAVRNRARMLLRRGR